MKPFLLAFASICCAALACHASPEAPPHLDAPRSEPQPDTLEAAGELPADLAAVSALLRARHVEDLPSAAQLAAYPSAEQSLRQLARAGETMLVRVRALTLLRHFDSAPSGELLATILADPEQHPALRAAAVTGLAGQPLQDQPQRLALVVAALRDSDPRVGVAAVQVLDQLEAGRAALRAAEQDAALSEPVRAAIHDRP